MAVVTREYMKGGGSINIPDAKDVAYLLARFACNNHTICDDELRPIGVGIYPQGAMLNHSCTPNTMQSFHGSRIVFRAVQHIPAGAEATIAYVELAATRAERSAALRANYFFDIDAGKEHLSSPSKEITLHDSLRMELYRAPSWGMDPHDPMLTSLSSSAGSGANASRVRIERHASFLEPDSEEAEAGLSQSPSNAQEWVVNVQCWGPAFWQGDGNDSLEAFKAETVAGMLADAVHSHTRATDLVSQSRAAEACSIAKRALQSFGEGMQTHIWRMRLLEVQLRAAIECGNQWEAALEAAQALLQFYRWLYPKVWPNLGLHLATLAKIAALLEQDEEAAKQAEAAASTLRITHPESPILQEMLRLWHDTKALLSANADD
ncbi:hypothetical protein COCSUDRAFT_48675 [Coccomyxa subellipsoidea C-169]|uniref:SET domain-containing protein n=1 Tax=Coccomyxa subellipsoidea (strain C-169) TaxID=574566 RepID=I0YPI4_COCSC|nr:hypothetical protein COCSUDRAFT_48675 [Coccomyxa subellipsoidea C-169]EIE20303.1 hypothetical protein COCSUDRAFT_48675 [Coccomyxa subellipsoidea C-169]|eukprot:XP_005644847.1 hypothetical protein COCSUDRAFT_48675 [Coccomyxa subellipsoidea C-169]